MDADEREFCFVPADIAQQILKKEHGNVCFFLISPNGTFHIWNDYAQPDEWSKGDPVPVVKDQESWLVKKIGFSPSYE